MKQRRSTICSFSPLRFRCRVTLVVAACSAALGVLGAIAAPAAAQSFTTRGCSKWKVPSGVSSVGIQATGSAGQTAGSPGGSGDVVSGKLSGLQVGEWLQVCVGVGGGPRGSLGSDGRTTSGAGGGAAIVTLFPASILAPGELVVVAGGGGGGTTVFGSDGATGLGRGGNAGDPTGSASEPFGNPPLSGAGGGGGTQTAGGAGGGPGDSPPPITSFCSWVSVTCTRGSAGVRYSINGTIGGAGGNGPAVGGGGGAGFFGGGGGGGGYIAAGGGGGGSDHCATSLSPLAVISGCGPTGTNATFGTGSVVLTIP